MNLTALSEVTGHGPRASEISGLAGLLVFDDSSNDVLALTAAQVVSGADEVWHLGRRIGVVSADRSDGVASINKRRTSTMVEQVVLDHPTCLAIGDIDLGRDNPAIDQFGLCLDPGKHAGMTVLVHTPRGSRQAILASTSGYFYMPPPDRDDLVLFHDALVLRSPDRLPLTVAGEAGALVTTLAGEALGIVICGDGAESYAAPLCDLVQASDGWRPLSPVDVEWWNRRAKVAVREAISAYPAMPELAGRDGFAGGYLAERAKSDDPSDIADVSRLVNEALRPFEEAA